MRHSRQRFHATNGLRAIILMMALGYAVPGHGQDAYALTIAAVWPDTVVEVQPTGTVGGIIVWKWSVMDHLVHDLGA